VTPVVAVAVSGGRDSLCLLHATMRAARALGLRVLALHVHHGLLPEADGWARDLSARCARWARAGWPLECRIVRLDGAPARGDSVEAWARRERYAALAREAHAAGASLVLLGHHRRDQAETVLLQALRGAGPAGLAAMPAQAARGGLVWARPWLHHTHDAIDAYAARHRLARAAAVDPSNADPRHDRSRLRRDVMPPLRAAFPQAEAALAAVARQAGEARAVLDEVAAADLAAIGAGQTLPHADWLMLSIARRANALRAWLGARLAGGVPETLVQRLLAEWHGGSRGAWPAGEGATLRAWRGALGCIVDEAAQEAGDRTIERAPPVARTIRIDAPGDVAIPGWRGHLEVLAATSQGLPARPGGWVLQARTRAGGEQFARTPRGTPRALKKQFQAADVPVWLRDGPLLWHGDALVFVPGLGVEARARAPEGGAQWRLVWRPDADDGGDLGDRDAPA
jgi:tRNA(Ile)-lysidine synthase